MAARSWPAIQSLGHSTKPKVKSYALGHEEPVNTAAKCLIKICDTPSQ